MIPDRRPISLLEITSRLDLQVINQTADLDSIIIHHIIASDLMSDVLVIGNEVNLLITSLATDQSIRTASIMDMSGVIIVNGKEITENMKELSQELGINLFSSDLTKYDASCFLYDLQKGR